MKRNGLRQMVKNSFQAFGMDIMRAKNSPRITRLGIDRLGFQTILDVGANRGQFATEMAELFPAADIFSFEPLPGPFSVLEGWKRANSSGQRKIHAFNVAIGDAAGQIEMFSHSDHSPSSSLLASTALNEAYYPFMKAQEKISVELVRLDDVMAPYLDTIRTPLLLKIDVQGYEDRVLRGAKKVLGLSNACLLEVNIDGLYDQQADFHQLSSLLFEAGLHFSGNMNQMYSEDGHVRFCDALFLRRT